jgi:hypothetical protein
MLIWLNIILKNLNLQRIKKCKHHSMPKSLKLLLTVPNFICLIYALTFISHDFLIWLHKNVIDLAYWNATMGAIYVLTIPYLIFRVWKHKTANKDTKSMWTFLLIAFNFFISWYYVWGVDDKLSGKRIV